MAFTVHALEDMPMLLSRMSNNNQDYIYYVIERLVAFRVHTLHVPCIVAYNAFDMAWQCPMLRLVWSIPERCSIKLRLFPPDKCLLRVDMYPEDHFLNTVCPLDDALELVVRIMV